jgi:hypothetical protein
MISPGGTKASRKEGDPRRIKEASRPPHPHASRHQADGRRQISRVMSPKSFRSSSLIRSELLLRGFVDASMSSLLTSFAAHHREVTSTEINGALAVIDGMKPENEVEAMLLSQMVI